MRVQPKSLKLINCACIIDNDFYNELYTFASMSIIFILSNAITELIYYISVVEHSFMLLRYRALLHPSRLYQ